MKENSYGRTIFISALGYGSGLAIGALALALILQLNLIRLAAEIVPDSQFFIRLLVGLVLGLLAVGGAGAVGGGLGGWALTRVEAIESPTRFIRRSALSLGLALGILALPLIFLTAVVAFYNDPADRRPLAAITLFALYGFLFGLLAGFFLAIFTSKLRQSWRVLVGGMAGFTGGGALAGLLIYGHEAHRFLNWLPDWLFGAFLFLLLGAGGGAALGWAYHWLARTEASKGERVKALPRWLRLTRVLALAVLVAAVFAIIWNVIGLIRIESADLQTIIPVDAQGTHWAAPLPLAEGSQPAIFAAIEETPFVTWTQDGDIFYTLATENMPLNVSNSSAYSSAPTGAADSVGNVHLVWQEGETGIAYGRCQTNTCSAPQLLTAACGSEQNSQATLALDSGDTIAIVWQQGTSLAYAVWPAGQAPESGASGCVITGGNPQNPRVVATGNGRFLLAFDDGGNIFTSGFDGSGWSPPAQIGPGHSPTVYANNGIFLAWCSPAGQVTVQELAGSPQIIAFPACNGRPTLAEDSDGNLHAIWHSRDVVKATGYIANDQSLIYESVRRNGEWGEAAIVAQTAAEAALDLTAVPNGSLHLAWADDSGIHYATQTPYDCATPDLNAIEQAVYNALNQPAFKPADEQLPVCGHQYDALLFTPNPDQSSRFSPTQNGAFDEVAEMALTAEYEVLFGIMQWDRRATSYSPGSTLAQVITELYLRVKENPEQYPKGMTVRILTGNMPQLALFPVPDHTWHVLEDLQAAGLPELVNEEMGWRLEIADYDGRWPHMHTKTMIVDGKTMMAAGFNYSYLHFADDHPSELGIDMFDLGIHVTGPVAQAGRAAYDDQWSHSDTLECDELVGWLENLWRRACWRGTAVADHIPEVLRYYVPEGASSNAYAMYRTEKHLAADAAVEAAIRAAEEKIDIFQVNFSLELLCTAAVVFQGICDYDNNALPFLVAILETVEAKRIPVRILVEEEPMNGAENRVAIQAFVDELEERGLRDLVDIRFYNGKIHNKSLSIDDTFLIVGSQNFHYSAWGSHYFSLTEFNIGTDDPQAIDDFQSAFEYRWANSIPAEELMPSLQR